MLLFVLRTCFLCACKSVENKFYELPFSSKMNPLTPPRILVSELVSTWCQADAFLALNLVRNLNSTVNFPPSFCLVGIHGMAIECHSDMRCRSVEQWCHYHMVPVVTPFPRDTVRMVVTWAWSVVGNNGGLGRLAVCRSEIVFCSFV